MEFNHTYSPSSFVSFSSSPSQAFCSPPSSPSWVPQFADKQQQPASIPALLAHMQQLYIPMAAFDQMIGLMQQQYLQLAELVKADHVRIAELCNRVDSLAAVMQSSDPLKTIWKCPVCCQDLCSMRSFKAHCKRLYEFYHPSHAKTTRAAVPVPHAQHRCQLLSTSRRHANLVALSGPAGSLFPARSKAFAFHLWQHVQCLTSSDEEVGFIVNDSIAGGGTVLARHGAEHDDDDFMGTAPS